VEIAAVDGWVIVKNAPGLRPFVVFVGFRATYAVAQKVVNEIVAGAKSRTEEQRLPQFVTLLGAQER
jgi:hypothetical protein